MCLSIHTKLDYQFDSMGILICYEVTFYIHTLQKDQIPLMTSSISFAFTPIVSKCFEIAGQKILKSLSDIRSEEGWLAN